MSRHLRDAGSGRGRRQCCVRRHRQTDASHRGHGQRAQRRGRHVTQGRSYSPTVLQSYSPTVLQSYCLFTGTDTSHRRHGQRAQRRGRHVTQGRSYCPTVCLPVQTPLIVATANEHSHVVDTLLKVGPTVLLSYSPNVLQSYCLFTGTDTSHRSHGQRTQPRGRHFTQGRSYSPTVLLSSVDRYNTRFTHMCCSPLTVFSTTTPKKNKN